MFSTAVKFIALSLVAANQDNGEWGWGGGRSAVSDAAANPVSTGGSAMSDDSSLGSSMLHTIGNIKNQPLTVAIAQAQGYTRIGVDCDPSLGIEYAPEGGISPESPLSAYYTPAGQLCGLKMTIFHIDGPAATGGMISEGYYIPVGGEEAVEGFEEMYEMSVSFRGAADVCSNGILGDDIGDRVVINQHTIAVSIPMTQGEADADGFQPGSCLLKMGQHYFKDITSGPDMSFLTGNLLPITPMYYPPNDPDGKLNAFFFSWPNCQVDDSPTGAWDQVPLVCALTSSMMCMNFCNKDCGISPFSPYAFKEPDTSRYGTYHIFFYEEEEEDLITCPNPPSFFNPGGIIGWSGGRTCPSNTATPDDASLEKSLRHNM